MPSDREKQSSQGLKPRPPITGDCIETETMLGHKPVARPVFNKVKTPHCAVPFLNANWHPPQPKTALVLSHEEPILDVRYDMVKVVQLPMDCQVTYSIHHTTSAAAGGGSSAQRRYGTLRTDSALSTGSLISNGSMASFDRPFYSVNDEQSSLNATRSLPGSSKQLKVKPGMPATRVESTGFEIAQTVAQQNHLNKSA